VDGDAMKKRTKSWQEATYDELCRMKRDNISRGNFTIMSEADVVSLWEQKLGEQAKQRFTCSRRMFNWMIRQYQKQRKPVRK
jgi:hypothetical protein